MKAIGNITGAFADGAILFPLLVALVLQTGMDGAVLLASAGAAYIAAGMVFRVPMSVQPLKSVVVAALALGATATEIHISGLAVGLVCLALSFCHADKIGALVPRHLVQGLQLGLGIILMYKGIKWGISGLGDPLFSGAVFTVLAGGIVYMTLRSALPVMGWIATGGLALAIGYALVHPSGELAEPVQKAPDLDVVFALVLPQLALTLTNSVIGTSDVAERYFNDAAKRVKPSYLLRSIGLGNIVSAAFGGLPFCHGSGGVTAHVKGGAQSWHMNLVIGGALLGLGMLSALFGLALIPAYPKMLMAVLIFSTGFFHLQLAAPSWRQPQLRPVILVMGAIALLMQNMLWALVAGIVIELFRALQIIMRQERWHNVGKRP